MKKGKKVSGGRYRQRRKKRLYELPGQKRTVKLGEENKTRSKRVKGANKKVFLTKARHVNVVEGKKTKKLEIKNVIETPSNRFLARQNIITKGTIVETSEGNVKITNRPTQEGILNGVLVK